MTNPYFGYNTERNGPNVLNATKFLKLPDVDTENSETTVRILKPKDVSYIPAVLSDECVLEAYFTDDYAKAAIHQRDMRPKAYDVNHVKLLVDEVSRLFLGGKLTFVTYKDGDETYVRVSYHPTFIKSYGNTDYRLTHSISAADFFSRKGFDFCNGFLDDVINVMSKKLNDDNLVLSATDKVRYYFTIHQRIVELYEREKEEMLPRFFKSKFIAPTVHIAFESFKQRLQRYIDKNDMEYFHGWIYIAKPASNGSSFDENSLGVHVILLDRETGKRTVLTGTLSRVRKALEEILENE